MTQEPVESEYKMPVMTDVNGFVWLRKIDHENLLQKQIEEFVSMLESKKQEILDEKRDEEHEGWFDAGAVALIDDIMNKLRGK